MSDKVKIKTEVKVFKAGERQIRRYNPIYDIFLQQMSAMQISSRMILADKSYSVPPLVQRFLDEFGQKV